MASDDHGRLYRLIGRKLCLARKAAGFSQTSLAAAVGISRVSLVNIEHGRQRPPIAVLWDLAEAVGVEVMELIPLRSEVADGGGDVQLDARTVELIAEAADDDPATRRKLAEFIQSARARLDRRKADPDSK
jgi:transcriptional regulator with XRE-family HTH domain